MVEKYENRLDVAIYSKLSHIFTQQGLEELGQLSCDELIEIIFLLRNMGVSV